MATESQPRPRLSREKVLAGAVDLAERDGLEGVTMRNPASELGVEAMSLYSHLANKEELLDGMVELVMEEINRSVESVVTDSPDEWKSTMRERILTARRVMLAHPWAPTLFETRATMTPPVIAYFEAILGLFRLGGFSYDLAHHSMHALGSRALGFTQELFQPGNDEAEEASAEMLEAMAAQFPHLTGMIAAVAHDEPDATLGWCDDQSEFEFGLDLLLDGLERLAAESA
ncbi:MAG TPA: TetR/AcrR family transcriptional regulator C-terminal domain-containing protein [Acidimicrobiia bacterium]|nr:TetR/AcrR family transcriptional regulator C-terminal domain-containing protein [Acidimicrobiia bacterium]